MSSDFQPTTIARCGIARVTRRKVEAIYFSRRVAETQICPVRLDPVATVERDDGVGWMRSKVATSAVGFRPSPGGWRGLSPLNTVAAPTTWRPC